MQRGKTHLTNRISLHKPDHLWPNQVTEAPPRKRENYSCTDEATAYVEAILFPLGKSLSLSFKD